MNPLVLLAPVLKTALPAAPPAEGGVPWILFGGIAAFVIAAGGVLLVLALRKAKPTEVVCEKCGKIMMSDWPRCMFCKTPRNLKKAALEFVSGPMSGRTVALDSEVTTIGTAPGSTVLLSDAGVSRKHAGIRRGPEPTDGYELADLGSTNGVYVNGERVAKKKLQLGDVIRVGATEMIFKS